MPEPTFSGSSTLQLSYCPLHADRPGGAWTQSSEWIVTSGRRETLRVGGGRHGGACPTSPATVLRWGTRSAASPGTGSDPTLRTRRPAHVNLALGANLMVLTCSTRSRTDERVLLPCLSRSFQRLVAATVLQDGIRLARSLNPFSISDASISDGGDRVDGNGARGGDGEHGPPNTTLPRPKHVRCPRAVTLSASRISSRTRQGRALSQPGCSAPRRSHDSAESPSRPVPSSAVHHIVVEHAVLHNRNGSCPWRS